MSKNGFQLLISSPKHFLYSLHTPCLALGFAWVRRVQRAAYMPDRCPPD